MATQALAANGETARLFSCYYLLEYPLRMQDIERGITTGADVMQAPKCISLDAVWKFSKLLPKTTLQAKKEDRSYRKASWQS